MNSITIEKKDEIVMRLVHYFITVENYTPIVVNGIKDEVWLENLEAPYRIIRINSKNIFNDEQLKLDYFKTSNIIKQIKKKTLSFKADILNIFLDVDNVEIEQTTGKYYNLQINDYSNIKNNKKLVEMFPKIKTLEVNNIKDFDLLMHVTNDINSKTEKENKIYEETFKQKKIIITKVLIAINVLMFILMYLFGEGSENNYNLIKFGALNKTLVMNGEYLRIITCSFLHIGIIHLVVNMYSLSIIGSQIENYFGKTKFLFIYLFSSITASLMSLLLSDTSVISAGASGAIFGLLGALLYFGYHYRLYLGSVIKSQIIPIILLNLFIGFAISGIDNFAHIGGLIGGVFLAMIVGVNGKSTKSSQINGTIISLIFICFLIFMIFFA